MKKSLSVLLVSYAGMPYTISCFYLDNGLADLAGSLIRQGHDVLLYDYNTPDVIEFTMNENVNIQNDLKKLNQEYANSDNLEYVQRQHENLQFTIDASLDKYGKIIYRDVYQAILRRKLDFVGFKLWLGRGLHTIIEVVTQLKKDFPNIKFFAGGPAATLFYKYIKGLDIFDAICLGEGEKTILEVAEYVSGNINFEDIRGIAFYKDSNWCLSEPQKDYALDDIIYPIYDQEIYPVAHKNDKKIRVVTLDESRGCKNRCAFCTHTLLGGNRVKTLSIDHLVNIVDSLRSLLHTSAFNLGGSCVPGSLLKEFTTRNIIDKRKIAFNCFSNVNDIVGLDFSTLNKGGLFSVFLGIESFHEKILKNDYNKYLDYNMAVDVIKSLISNGVYTTGSFIYPAPHEDEVTKKFTVDTILSLFANKKNSAVVIFYPGLMPGSRWGNNPQKYGITVKDINKHFENLVNCEVRHYLPTSYWDTYDYYLGDVSQAQAALYADKLSQYLDVKGVNVNIMGDTALLAHFLKRDSRMVGNYIRDCFINMDYNGIREFVSELNSCLWWG